MSRQRSTAILCPALIFTWTLVVSAWSATNIYVATNGIAPDGASWTSAYTNIQDAIDNASPGDTICIAGHVFLRTNQLTWAKDNLTIRGGYEGVGSPGSDDPSLWPTMITLSSGSQDRIWYIHDFTNGWLEGMTIAGGLWQDKCP